mmetsp:Transcript_6514/g.24314  ORF Transcript_6514/g.24314 Transcript_6514/m.24314 type:complete len:172 (-) Transcript_6514:159-674(-)
MTSFSPPRLTSVSSRRSSMRLQPNVTVATAGCRLFKWASESFGIYWTDLGLWHSSILEYNQMLVRLVQRWQAKTCTPGNCTMAVALRLPMLETNIGLSELDTLDCFHPNLRFAEAVAIEIWNEMLEGPPHSAPGLHWQQPARCLQPQHRFTVPDPSLALLESAVLRTEIVV